MERVVEEVEHRNEVSLIGRLASEPVVRVLSRGGVVASWRLTVERVPRGSAAPEPGARGFDTLDCSAFEEGVRRVAQTWQEGDLLEVRGALRRHFWRSPTGVASRCEVETTWVRRRAAVPSRESR